MLGRCRFVFLKSMVQIPSGNIVGGLVTRGIVYNLSCLGLTADLPIRIIRRGVRKCVLFSYC